MTVDDSTMVVLASAVVGGLATAVAWLWKAMDKRYQFELAKRDTEIKDLVGRVRKLEDERIPAQERHSAEIRALTDRYDATANVVAKAIREMAQSVNANTQLLRSSKAFSHEHLPSDHPAGKGTDAITARNQGHA